MREKVERTKTTNTSTFSLISEEIKGPNDKLPGELSPIPGILLYPLESDLWIVK